MTIPGASPRIFQTSDELQDFLLAQPTGGLIIVPQIRLAHQVWRRQRLAARAAGQMAWEPVAMTTLSGWWQQLWGRLWPPVRPVSTLERLVLWLEAMEAVTQFAGVTPDLFWAEALDEAYDLCQRYHLPPPDDSWESPLIHWRQTVTQQFAGLLAAQGLITPAARPHFLLEALHQGNLTLPDQLVLVGLETPAPLEEQWLNEVVRHIPVLQVHLAGRQDSEVTLQGVAFPDRRQEMAWVAAQVLELVHDQNIPLHRLAITAPNLEVYLPELCRIWKELLGQANSAAGGLYNFSLGPTLTKAPLFQAALLPLKLIMDGEPRQDLIAWFLSPYYGAFKPYQGTFLHWDRVWRQDGAAYGWQRLRNGLVVGEGNPSFTPHPDSLPSRGEGEEKDQVFGELYKSIVVSYNSFGDRYKPEGGEGESIEDPAFLIDRAFSLLPDGPAPAALWESRLLDFWRLLGFPRGLEPEEAGHWQALLNLLAELAVAGGERPWTAASLLEWLTWGAGRLDLPGDGSSEAGIQILGLLEMRGLDFDAVFCLGMNMGVFPPPPRNLPLLTSQEKALVLGGDYQSQQKFAETSYRYLLASAPQLILTRPRVDQDEERLTSPVLPPDIWKPDTVKFDALSHPHPAWLRSPAVKAAFLPPEPRQKMDQGELITVPLPEVISLSALEAALACPCKFYLSVLLGLQELPDQEPGLPPAERGSVIHAVLQTFTGRFLEVLQETGVWDDALAGQLLQEAVAVYHPRSQVDPHWEAEISRWLEEEVGLLRHWLRQEKQRFLEGWRWLAMEEAFTGLQLPGWPTRVKGRLDRVDAHQTLGLMLWDYKTGAVPKYRDIAEEQSRFQLAGYLLALQQGLTTAPPHPECRAGIIGLKSIRAEHLRFEDFNLTAADWREILEVKLLEVARAGARVGEGDFYPDPGVPPPARNNSCQYCPFSLLCGRTPEAEGEEGE